VRKDAAWEDVAQFYMPFIDDLYELVKHKEHYRGYFFTNEEIEALEGEQGDYAYSFETETKWVFRYDLEPQIWEDTLSPIPDKVMPKSTSTPLADELIAVIGDEMAWDAGDHVHPKVAAVAGELGYMIAGDNIILAADGTISVKDLVFEADDTYSIGDSVNWLNTIFSHIVKADTIETSSLTAADLDVEYMSTGVIHIQSTLGTLDLSASGMLFGTTIPEVNGFISSGVHVLDNDGTPIVQ
ncbi:MAG: hypothetical protein EZS28_052939, partial [Streblomastix strix]